MPAEPRDHSRLLVFRRETGQISHHTFHELPSLLSPSDLLVLNNTRVISARLFATDAVGHSYEIFLLRKTPEPLTWRCLVKPGRRVKGESEVIFADGMRALVKRRLDGDGFEVKFETALADDFEAWLERNGKTPLPPYIKRPATAGDRERYQTVFAKDPGSIAAPTAGLHFTPELLSKFQGQTTELTLHVGYGTFAPIQTENVGEHKMHSETYIVSNDLWETMSNTRAKGGRVIPVGTTSLRTLESLEPGRHSGSTSLFIRPGFSFRFTDGLITNFHLPQSSLFVLICALIGTQEAKACYQEAIEKGYRFYSYGDAMLIL